MHSWIGLTSGSLAASRRRALLLLMLIVAGSMVPTTSDAQTAECDGTWVLPFWCLGKLRAPAQGFDRTRPLMRVMHASKRPLNPDDLYNVVVTCDRVSLPQHPDWQPFVQQTLATSHIIALTDKKLSSAELPKDGRAVVTVFSVAGNRSNHQIFINDTCSTNFLLSGRETLYLGATANRTESNAPGPVTSLIFKLIQVAVPVLPLFKATQVAKTILGDVGQTEDPLKKLFSELDNGETITISEPLTQGKNVIETRYSRVTVSVDKIKFVIDISSLLQPFENSMKDARTNLNLDAATDDLVKQKCSAFENGLRDRNLSPRDISYGMVLIVELSALNQARTLSCLGKTYAVSALEHQKLWNRWDGPTYTEAIAKTAFASDGPVLLQPKFEDVKQTLQFATKVLGAYLQSHGTTGNVLNNYIAEQVYVVNLADMFSTAITEASMTRSDILGTLISQKFQRVGCMNSDTEALAMLLAFRGKSDEQNIFSDSDAIAIRIWTDDSKRISRMKIERDDNLVEKALADRKPPRTCGDGNLTVSNPASKSDASAAVSTR